MQDDLHRWMQVGLVQFMAYPETLQRPEAFLQSILHIAQDDFFDGIELTQIQDGGLRRQVADLVRASGMDVWFGLQSVQMGERLNLNSEDAAERARGVARLEAALAMAHELGATKIALMSGPDPGVAGRERALNWLIASLDQICTAARPLGLDVVLEVFDRAVHHRALIGSTADAVRVAAALRPRHPHFGLQLDLAHLPLLGETPRESVALAAPYLRHVHIGNCIIDPRHPHFGDSHPPFGVPGGANGVDELTQFLRALVDVGYLNPVTRRPVVFEVRSRPGDCPEVIIAQGKRTLRSAWRAV